MNRSVFIRSAAVLLLAAPLDMLARRVEPRWRRVALMVQGLAPADDVRPDAFRRSLRDLGYVEGENLAIEARGAEGDNRRFRILAGELVATGPEVIVAETTPGALAAQEATATIPIVMVGVSDPVLSGLVDSLARPGGNVTGITDSGTELATKSVEVVREVLPRATSLAVLLSDNPIHRSQFEQISTAAQRVGLSVLAFFVPAADGVDAAFAAMAARRVDAFIALGGPPFDSTAAQVRRLATLATDARLPGIYASRAPVDAGGLMSYGTDFAARWRLAAVYVDRILKGARATDLPVQEPTSFELVINRAAAARLGLSIPESLQLRAEVVR